MSHLHPKKIRFSENGAEELQGVKEKQINTDKLQAGKAEIYIDVCVCVWRREIQMAAMQKTYDHKTIPHMAAKNDHHCSRKKKWQELPSHQYLQRKDNGIKIFRTAYKEAIKSGLP